ncbi:MAG: hypothetical protein HRU06_21040 [Oceanospirillaceae bacterium]|nr:hypothetical protein [Oceanospirillaceae bacterium]
MTNVLKYTLSALLLILLSWTLYHSLRIAIADISHYPVKHWMEDAAGTPTDSELTKNITTIKSSIKLNPENAEYREYLARLYYLRALNNWQQPSAFRENLIKAYIQHKTALKHRPNWPYSWANLALVKSHLQQFDNEFREAIEKAEQYGPWEIATNNAIVQAIFAHWTKMPPPLQQTAISALERIYQQHKQTARSLLKHYKLQTEICTQLTDEKFKKDKSCEHSLHT